MAPENTLAAFQLALAMGVQGVELDVHLSADGKPMVIHDHRLKRTTDGVGQVARLNAKELQSLDAGSWFARRLALRPRARRTLAALIATNPSLQHWLGKDDCANGKGQFDFSGERVPTLEEVFALLATARLPRIYVELKGEAAHKNALLEATVALIHQCGLSSAVTLLSFDHRIIGEAKRLAPELRSAATFPATSHALATSRSMLKALQQAAADEAALHFGLATRRTVAALHDHGYAVSVWTANSKMVLRKLIASGVDAIMTNFPNRLLELL
ncbi:MAG: hypothetical protein HY231_15705 [Acidobacteria bacterium]|nr:hypothetical protein [Acidobacteriota bacterium]